MSLETRHLAGKVNELQDKEKVLFEIIEVEYAIMNGAAMKQ